MQIEYVAPPREVLKRYLEVQADVGTADAVEMVWEEGYWMGMEMAFQKIRDISAAWRDNIV